MRGETPLPPHAVKRHGKSTVRKCSNCVHCVLCSSPPHKEGAKHGGLS